jgi:predicted Zn finger-like uncharacterized protein
MIITCPHCQTHYEVADEAIGDYGRSVQCANCAHAWLADRSSSEPSSLPSQPEPIMAETEEEALDVTFTEVGEASSGQGAKTLAKRHRDIARHLPAARARRYLGGVSVAVAVVAVVGLFGSRNAIVERLPDMASFYGLLGMGVNVVGLDFADVRTVRATQDGHDVLVVEGRIDNISGQIRALPPVRVSLYREDGTGVYEWRAAAGVPALGSGETVRFETKLMAPPDDVAMVRLRFDPGQTNPAPRGPAGLVGGG